MGSGFGDLDRVFDNFKKDFEQILGPTFGTVKPFGHMFEQSSPTSCDLVDEGDKFVVTADMPRIKKDEINLDVGDDYIDISLNTKNLMRKRRKNTSEKNTMNFQSIEG